MPRIEIPVEGVLLDELSRAFFWLESREGASRTVILGAAYQMVDRVYGLTIRIWADEHPPPHFHVAYQGEDASFSIADCARLKGSDGLKRHEATIHQWWEGNQHKLIEVWNNTRPTDCPVGPIPVPQPVAKKSFDEIEQEMERLIKGLGPLSEPL